MLYRQNLQKQTPIFFQTGGGGAFESSTSLNTDSELETAENKNQQNFAPQNESAEEPTTSEAR